MDDNKKIVELRGQAEFPIDVHLPTEKKQDWLDAFTPKRVRLSAYEFACKGESGCSFGVDPERTSAQLRDLADSIDKGKVILQRCQTVAEAVNDGYPFTSLVLEFHEKESDRT